MVRAPMNRVDTVLASAGTGKTHALTRAVAGAIEGGADPAGIVATTFTVRAAAELVERVRDRLVAEGRVDDAVELAGARMGTVNSVCGRIVAEFALELGLSPSVEVIPEESFAGVFATGADRAIAAAAPALNALSESLGLADRDVDWRAQVLGLVGLARANGIGAERLPGCAERSVEGLLALLPPADREAAEELDAELRRQVDVAAEALGDTTTKATSAGAVEALAAVRATLGRGEHLPWSLWAKLSKPKAAKADAAIFEGVARAAAAHPRHPRLHGELRLFVELSFRCAAEAMSAYQAFKAERGLVDFVDQEALALVALRDPGNRERLREALTHVFVDEVQDCSPLQVAIFAEMARIAPRSTWVGDPKQSIYGFRGTDATLTAAAAREAAAETGGSSDVLSRSWRSRPGICAFVNDAFVPAFEAMGLPRSDTAFADAACADADLDVPPLSIWPLEGRNKGQLAEAVADGVFAALADPRSWPVRDGAGVRGLGPDDVAVLCRGNDDVAAVSAALARRGVAVAGAAAPLFDAPEAQLVASALRWVADPDDRLALVEMARIVGDVARPSSWIEALGAEDPDEALAGLLPFAGTLRALRARRVGSTPMEIVDALILATGVVDVACRWGAGVARVHRLEAVRGAAATYERECARLRSPASLAGLAAWLAARETTAPGGSDPRAVHVLTYHKAKGLEWPLVVLCQLDKAPTSSPFGVAVECDADPDWREPLAGRWLRLWVWPYGRQLKDVHMDASAAASRFGRSAAERARDEAVRLLYVGMTRARDHVVLTSSGASTPAWLGVLDVGAEKHVALPTHGQGAVSVGGRPHPFRWREVGAVQGGRPGAGDGVPLPSAPVGRAHASHRPRTVIPSAASGVGRVATVRVEIGGRIPLLGEPDPEEFGEALHAVLAADTYDSTNAVRSARAEAILQRWGMAEHLRASDALVTSDRLRGFLASRFPGARVRRELPIRASVGSQDVVGRVDCLLEFEGGFAIIDHKAIRGRGELWDVVARAHAPQLALYADAVASVTGMRCNGAFVHMPMVGLVVEIHPAGGVS